MIDGGDSVHASVLAHDVVDAAMQYTFSVSSWGRTAKHNAAVGGVPDSEHLKFQAVDLIWDADADRTGLRAYFEKLDYFVLDEGTHIHVAVKRPGQK
jgi:Peptidase M15